MQGFTFLLEAFTLLMGLAMAEVLRGFAKVLKLRARRRAGLPARSSHDAIPDTPPSPDPAPEPATPTHSARHIRIGWLVPLLGVLVIIDQSTFWLHMYSYSQVMPFNAASILVILIGIGWYYLVASCVFPDHPADWPDFDEWYFQQRRFVLGGVLGINVMATALGSMLTTPEQSQAITETLSETYFIAAVIALSFFPAALLAMFVKGRLLSTILILWMIAGTLLFAWLTRGDLPPLIPNLG